MKYENLFVEFDQETGWYALTPDGGYIHQVFNDGRQYNPLLEEEAYDTMVEHLKESPRHYPYV